MEFEDPWEDPTQERNMRVPTEERSHSSVQSVIRASQYQATQINTRGSTQERSHSTAQSVSRICLKQARQRREVLSVLRVWQEFLRSWQIKETWQNLHRNEATTVFKVWQEMLNVQQTKDTWEDPHRRESILLLYVVCKTRMSHKQEILPHIVHLNGFSSVWILLCFYISINGILKISCHTLNTGMASLLCGSSHVSSIYQALQSSCHRLSIEMASLLCGFSHVSSRHPIVRSPCHKFCN